MISASSHYQSFMFPGQKEVWPRHLPHRVFIADLITRPAHLCSKISLKSTHFSTLLLPPWTKPSPPSIPSLEYGNNLLTGLLIFTVIPLQSILCSTSRMTFIKHMYSPNSTPFRISIHPYNSPWAPAWSSLPFLSSLILCPQKTSSHPTLLF